MFYCIVAINMVDRLDNIDFENEEINNEWLDSTVEQWKEMLKNILTEIEDSPENTERLWEALKSYMLASNIMHANQLKTTKVMNLKYPDIKLVPEIVLIKNLKHLRLHWITALIPHLKNLPWLEQLDMWHCKNPSDMKVVSTLSQLKILELAPNTMLDESILELKELKELRLTSSYSDKDLQFLRDGIPWLKISNGISPAWSTYELVLEIESMIEKPNKVGFESTWWFTDDQVDLANWLLILIPKDQHKSYIDMGVRSMLNAWVVQIPNWYDINPNIRLLPKVKKFTLVNNDYLESLPEYIYNIPTLEEISFEWSEKLYLAEEARLNGLVSYDLLKVIKPDWTELK